MRADIHMHTSFSTDSETPAEEMVRAAIAAGMETICITDHQDYGLPPEQGFRIDPEAYWSELLRLQEAYRDQIRLLIGVEIGMHLPSKDAIASFLQDKPYDFVIGSMHLVDGIDPYYRDEFKGTDDEMYRHYFEQTLECVREISGFQALGHLDYVVRYGYDKRVYTYQKYADVIDEILKELVARGIALEVNTGGYKSGLENPNPHPDVIRRFRELGGEMVTIGADAHAPSYIGYAFDRAKAIIKDAGFKEVTIFVDKRPCFLEI